MQMKIIGITGTNGAGKGTIVDYLVSHKGFVHYSVRAFLIDRINERELEVNRVNMVNTANELRAAHSPSYIVEQLFERASMDESDCIIESLRTPGEVLALQEKGAFKLIAVDADPEVRYARITDRQSETDQVGFDEFMAAEQQEMASADPNKQNLSRCIEMADYQLNNNGTIEDLQSQIESILHELN
jgi:dephospho-CoA kinase